ncbi:MAG TPA: Imm52 family immunity protein [Bacteroidales bacterium]|nr:Imm52 family immunity protein [Bacteroidales bacterium]
MNEKIRSISAIWKSDNMMPVEKCTEKVLNFLMILSDYEKDLFGTWYEKGNSKKEALEKKVELNKDYIRKALEENWDKKFNDLGARISFWSGNADDTKSSEISFRVGAFGDKSFNKNSCVITLPQEYQSCKSERISSDLIDLMKEYWSPDKMLINGEIIEDTIT